MASFLSISQSQVSRYEKDPESVPYGVVVKWNRYCGEIGKLTGLKINDPRVEISSRLSLINDYSNASSINIDAKEVGFSIKDFIKNIKLTSRKPRLGVFGQFDSGKSTLINTILGGDSLPTGYQPATSVVSFIRHISEKPKWQAEDVWIMRKGFDFDKCDEEKHCIEYKMFAGGYDSLRQFGTHSGEGSKHKAFAAVVYLDSPLLLASDVVDLPGYGHSDDDQDRAEMAHKMVDIMIYASATTGFLGNQDLLYLSGLLKTLPTESYGQHPLGNLFIIGTHAHQVKSIRDRNDIKEKASKRAFKHLINTLKNHGNNIKEDDFLKRFYFFSVDENQSERISSLT